MNKSWQKQHEESMKNKSKQTENVSEQKVNNPCQYLLEVGHRSSFRNVVYCSENQSMEKVQNPS
jgi:hypothetical protein